jgi:hypothetical protein
MLKVYHSAVPIRFGVAVQLKALAFLGGLGGSSLRTLRSKALKMLNRKVSKGRINKNCTPTKFGASFTAIYPYRYTTRSPFSVAAASQPGGIRAEFIWQSCIGIEFQIKSS